MKKIIFIILLSIILISIFLNNKTLEPFEIEENDDTKGEIINYKKINWPLLNQTF